MWNYGWILKDKAGASMAYAEVRPMQSFLTPWGRIPAHPTDCSESTAMIAHASGAPTPYVTGSIAAGFQGYTGTMLANLKHIPKVLTRRGDFAVFSNPDHPDGVHVVMLLQSGWWRRDPLVWSHGRPGVDVMPLSQMAAGFPGDTITYLQAVPAYFK